MTLKNIFELDTQIKEAEEEITLLKQRREDLVKEAISAGVTEDDHYKLKARVVRTINVERLKQIDPAIYMKIARVSPTEAEKIIGRQRMNELCRIVDEGAWNDSAKVTIADAESAYGKNKIPSEIVEKNTQPGSVKVIKKVEE